MLRELKRSCSRGLSMMSRAVSASRCYVVAVVWMLPMPLKCCCQESSWFVASRSLYTYSHVAKSHFVAAQTFAILKQAPTRQTHTTRSVSCKFFANTKLFRKQQTNNINKTKHSRKCHPISQACMFTPPLNGLRRRSRQYFYAKTSFNGRMSKKEYIHN